MDTPRIEPLDLPFLRAEVLAWYDSGAADEFLGTFSCPHNHEGPCRPPRLMGADAWRKAELFYIRTNMHALADVASVNLPDYELLPEELPAPTGMLYTEYPLWAFTRAEGGRTLVHGMAWTESDRLPLAGRSAPGLHYALLARREDELTEFTEAERSTLRGALPPLIEFVGALPWEYGVELPEELNDVRHGEGAEGRAPNLVVKAIWNLIQETRITSDKTVRVEDRHARKRLHRQGIETEQLVRIISLRREAAEPGAEAGNDRTYRVRFVQRAHPRWQPYGPKESDHEHVQPEGHFIQDRQLTKQCTVKGCERFWKRIRIPAAIKGPEGAPLKVGDKVHLLER